MDTTKTQLFVALLAITVLVQWSLAAPLVEEIKERSMSSGQRMSSMGDTLRIKRSGNLMETPDSAMLVSPDVVETGFLSRLRRSLAQMYAGSIRYNNRHHGSRRHHRGMQHHHLRHHRRHRGGRVVDA